jgi:hypothetical protein
MNSSSTSFDPRIDDLDIFLDEVENLFDRIVGPWRDLLFPEEFRQPLSDAWDDAKQSLQQIKDQIASSSDRLEEVGLSGSQLALKLQGLRSAWDAFRRSGTVQLLKKLLEWINLILGSLAQAIPVGEALKEIKEVIEKLIG